MHQEHIKSTKNTIFIGVGLSVSVFNVKKAEANLPNSKALEYFFSMMQPDLFWHFFTFLFHDQSIAVFFPTL